MDHPNHDQLASFFGADHSEHRTTPDSSQQNVFNPGMLMPSFSSSSGTSGNMNLFTSGDLAGMLGIQGMEGGQGQSRMPQTASAEQMVLEQQLRFAKLQQLQLLQTQLFQQQVSAIYNMSDWVWAWKSCLGPAACLMLRAPR
ncbi:hypothetical protein OE88DRAFT_1667144 [Heliocybe sulcata]|uniref:Uncharacterized protein n=1 Tax=Heliocybe sulcata TaxID=5364 RepID=A0A5C3MNK6_9AGAM|nr:hypothetical protein OE88DRAFT_1667144 [Heliocybe sulcata]